MVITNEATAESARTTRVSESPELLPILLAEMEGLSVMTAYMDEEE